MRSNIHLVDAKDPTTWRYTGKLDGGEAFKVKAANVRAERGRQAHCDVGTNTH